MITKFDSRHNFTKRLAFFSSIILKGLAQIMLQENSITGFILLLGIFSGSFVMGIAAILATLCGTATALILKYDKTEIEKGLYGFSAALVGVASMLFLKPAVFTWLIVIVGSSMATVIQHFFIKRKVAVFTLPFVMVTWVIILLKHNYLNGISSHILPVVTPIIDPFTFGFKGYAQVIFQDHLLSGLLFFLAVFISSPISALYGLAAAVLSGMLAFKFSMPIYDISMGLYSYNAVLCAIVFANSQIRDGAWVMLSILLSFFISLLLAKFNITALTFPFVLASCMTLFLKNNSNFIMKRYLPKQ